MSSKAVLADSDRDASTTIPNKIRKGLVSYWPAISRVRKTPSKKVMRVTACCERRPKCLRTSINYIAQKVSLDVGPDRNPSRKFWKGDYATEALLSSSDRIIKRSGKGR